jgi:ABC-type phosphate transport system substrate-binding protein
MVKIIKVWMLLYIYNIQNGESNGEADELKLVGAGASLPAEVYESWAPSFASFRNKFLPLENQYYTLGSGTGKSIFLNGAQFQQPLTYCGSDSVLTKAEMKLNPTAQMIPVLAGYVLLQLLLQCVAKNISATECGKKTLVLQSVAKNISATECGKKH